MTVTAFDVLLYVPNLVGYARVVLTLASLVIWACYPPQFVLGVALYVASFAGDLADGWIARKLHQTSSFGGVLDMVTDRCSTLGLLFVLYGSTADAHLLRITLLLLGLLDVSSHWVQMHSTLAIGEHHKSEKGNTGKQFLTRLFYSNYAFFGYLCVGAEFTYVLILIRIRTMEYYPQEKHILWIVKLLLHVCIPGCVLKQGVNVSQLLSSCYAIAAHDAQVKCK